MRRRLRALVHGRRIDVTVTCADDAPVVDRRRSPRVRPRDRQPPHECCKVHRSRQHRACRCGRHGRAGSSSSSPIRDAASRRSAWRRSSVRAPRARRARRTATALVSRARSACSARSAAASRSCPKLGLRLDVRGLLSRVTRRRSPHARSTDHVDGVIARVVRVLTAPPTSGMREVSPLASQRRAAFRS